MAACINLSTGPAAAQDPLTVIDWLGRPAADQPLPDTVLVEPPVAGSAAQPEISVKPLEALLPPIGLVSPAATCLPVDMWRGSSAADLIRLIAKVPVRQNPAMQSLLFTLLLSESRPLPDDEDALLLARLDRLIALGATDPAQALVEQAGPAKTPARFQRWFDATLLAGNEDRSCAALTASPFLSPEYPARIFCAARRGDWPTAALMLETAHALDLLPSFDLNLLDRFLNPDLFELAPPLPAHNTPSPLQFRMLEAIGESPPTAPLPRAFAAADLRDIAGWKAQLEAAERLTRVGSLNPNQFLGLFTAHDPAASGGIWDRVDALQTLDRALAKSGPASKRAEAVSHALPAAWQASRTAETEVALADLYGEQLSRLPLEGDSAVLAWKLRLLSNQYEIAARQVPMDTPEARFLQSLAQGVPQVDTAPTALARSIARGFTSDHPLPRTIEQLLQENRLGEAILRTMTLFDRGAKGNFGDLSASLAALRRMGLEDTARRASLQLMLLERH